MQKKCAVIIFFRSALYQIQLADYATQKIMISKNKKKTVFFLMIPGSYIIRLRQRDRVLDRIINRQRVIYYFRIDNTHL